MVEPVIKLGFLMLTTERTEKKRIFEKYFTSAYQSF